MGENDYMFDKAHEAIGKPGYFFNIGAGNLDPSAKFFDNGWDCLLVEPDPQSIAYIGPYSGDSRWKVLCGAVSNNKNLSKFFVGPMCLSSLNKDWYHLKGEFSYKFYTRTLTVKEIMDMFPDFFICSDNTCVLIDAEGSDQDILNFWPRYFLPKIIIAEIAYSDFQNNFLEEYYEKENVECNSIFTKKKKENEEKSNSLFQKI